MGHGILHLLGTAESEGAGIARVVRSLAAGLDPEKYRVSAYFLGSDGPLVKELEAAGAKVRILRWTRGARDPLGACRFWASLRGERFAIVHQHFGGRGPRRIARKATGGRVISHVWSHINESRGVDPSPIRLPGSDVVIATSRAVAKWLVDLDPVVVYPGVAIPEIDARQVKSIQPRERMIIGTAGRLVPMKGFVYLIRALSRLLAEFPHIYLEIAGEGPLRQALEDEVRVNGLSAHVTFLGWQKTLEPFLRRWDIYVQPSLAEPFGIAALEAMAAGLPVIGTRGGGLEEFIGDSCTGWLVQPADPDALARRLCCLLVDPGQRSKMGLAGLARAREHFSIERMVADISGIYDTLLSSRL